LYLTNIVLAAWRRELRAQNQPAATLALAFAPGAREHLIAAYGWFLLDISQAAVSPAGPPRNCDELPPVPAGKATPPEINEFRTLESGGWLAELLSSPVTPVSAPRQRDIVAVAPSSLPELEQVESWMAKLSSLMDRMSDSLDEC
jgi:hypothetical protein